MQNTLTGISSKATAAFLAEMAQAYQSAHGTAVAIESVGGVDAARRVAEGEPFDIVVLEHGQIVKLTAAGKIAAGSAQPLVHSLVTVAVRAGAPHPSIATLEAFQAALLAAARIGYSTGPSGVALLGMIQSWGLTEKLQGRLIQAPPGRPVGALIAEGEVDIGIQQYSELMSLPGIDILGPLPPGAEIISTFTAGVGAAAAQPEEARRYVEFLAAPARAEAKRRQGFEPV
ncbi:MAG TPA: substrate-binding domain-containing protein [Burkholderiales bacterium]|jgi:molybdate transport system substrate-binding protein|nr:substrate-binding domain-containing protein [Burkholderiales bacterium]